jgi:hypothetical protein
MPLSLLPPPQALPPEPPPPPLPLAQTVASTLERPVFVMDTECYRNYWLIAFMNVATGEITMFDSYPGKPLDIAGVARMMLAGTIVSFNGMNYDAPMIALALRGADTAISRWPATPSSRRASSPGSSNSSSTSRSRPSGTTLT